MKVKGLVQDVDRGRNTRDGNPTVMVTLRSGSVYQSKPDAQCADTMAGWVGRTGFYVEMECDKSVMVVAAKEIKEADL